jgi:hypothetical protein
MGIEVIDEGASARLSPWWLDQDCLLGLRLLDWKALSATSLGSC